MGTPWDTFTTVPAVRGTLLLKELKKIAYPVIVKPVNEGSSLGVELCKNKKNLINSSKKLLKKYGRVMVEQYIPGQEIQVAIINGKPLGAIELLPKRQFYDYKAKYTKSAKTKHIMPARLSKLKYLEVLNIAKKTHNAFKCRGVTRADFKFYKGNFYLLEINTQPGMTSLSLVPEIANYKGINFEQLVEKILLDAPCSGTGVIGRRPDIKWRLKSSDIQRLANLQKTILKNIANYLKPGGILIYSTCSLEREENQDVIDHFLKNRSDFELIGTNSLLPDRWVNSGGFMFSFPAKTNTDGLFAAVLRKKI